MSSSRTALVAFLVLAILIALCGALLLLSRPEPIHITINPPPPTATPAPTSTPLPIMIYVTGEVARRGTQHVLPHGSRVSDAVAAAGGFTDLANQELVNLAGILRDGDQVHVPSIDANRALSRSATDRLLADSYRPKSRQQGLCENSYIPAF